MELALQLVLEPSLKSALDSALKSLLELALETDPDNNYASAIANWKPSKVTTTAMLLVPQ